MQEGLNRLLQRGWVLRKSASCVVRSSSRSYNGTDTNSSWGGNQSKNVDLIMGVAENRTRNNDYK